VDPVRDLGRIEPWQESLERSRARRTEAARRADRSSRAADELSRRAAKSSRRVAESFRPAARSLRPAAKSLRPAAKSPRPWGKRRERRAQQALTNNGPGRRRNGALVRRTNPVGRRPTVPAAAIAAQRARACSYWAPVASSRLPRFSCSCPGHLSVEAAMHPPERRTEGKLQRPAMLGRSAQDPYLGGRCPATRG
jgi:hypothetical protein